MKRFFDFVIAGTGLFLLAIPIAIVAVLVLVKLGSPVFFRQQRPGLCGDPFEMIKFRTMTGERGSDGNLLADEQRLTAFGRFLRDTSIDELPELWNVLRGEMSLVGPRPLLIEYVSLYSREQLRRHEVRPGITGWAQVNGRNAIDWEEKFKLDVWYVDNHNILLDMQILWLTVYRVLNRDGISADGEATMSKFTGNSHEKIDKS